MKSAVIFTLALVFLQSNSANSLQCYQCTGPLNLNSDCENLKFVPLKTCPRLNDVCASYVIKTTEKEILHRICATDDICSRLEAQYASNPAVNVAGCQVCGQNGCNSA